MKALLFLTFACSFAMVFGGACGIDDHGDPIVEEVAYPSGPYDFKVGATLPNWQFEGAREDGTIGDVALSDYVARPGSDDALLVIQLTGGLWCGTSLWYGEHANELVPSAISARVRRLDVVLSDRDNAPARAEDALAWQGAFDLAGVAVAADPAFRFRPILHEIAAVLPLVIIVDARSMRVVSILENPWPSEWTDAVESAIATVDGVDPPARREEPLVDGLFSKNEWDVLSTIKLPSSPPADPSNAVADSPAARALGEALYFDAGMSPSGTVSCGTCHDPAMGFSDDRAIGTGVARGDRRSQAIGLSAHARWQFWDGRADSLWAQALGPFENPTEFDSSRVFVARRIIQQYAAAYEAAFGVSLPDPSAWPAAGKPGDALYDAMPDDDRVAVTRVFVNVGKAIAAYERSIRVKENRLDRYLAGDYGALSMEEKYGLQLFSSTGCVQCHWGPRMTNDAFHNTRTPTGRPDGAGDRGRADGWRAYASSEFGRSSEWSDAVEPMARAFNDDEIESMVGQFKTPALRGTADLVFFGHGGAYEDLAGIMEAYGTGGVPIDERSAVGAREPWLVNFSETGSWGLVPMLEVLTAEPVE